MFVALRCHRWVAALALATLWLVASAQRAAVPMLALTAIAFLPGVGPHKLLTELAARELAPLILVGTGAMLTLVWAAVRLHRVGRSPSAPQRREASVGALE